MKLYSNPRKKYRTINLDEIRELRAQGMTGSQIANRLGIPLNAINHQLRQRGLNLTSLTPESVEISRGRKRQFEIDLEKVRELRAQGMTGSQIADLFGIPPHTLNNRLTEQGLSLKHLTREGAESHRGRRRKHRIIDLDEIRELRAQGMTGSQIANRLGIPLSTINHQLRQRGLSLTSLTPESVEISRGPQRQFEIDLEKVRELRALGMTGSQIADELGVTAAVLNNRLREQDLSLSDLNPINTSSPFVGLKKGPRQKYGDFDIEKVRELRAQGMTGSEIADELGVTMSVLQHRLRREGLTISDLNPSGFTPKMGPRRGYGEVDIEKVRELRAQGMTRTQIADELGVTADVIYARLRREGLTLDNLTPENVKISRGQKRTYAEFDIEEVRELRAQGMTGSQIADELGVTPNVLQVRLRREGLILSDLNPSEFTSKMGRKRKEIDINEAKRLRREGLSLAQAAAHFGISPFTLASRLKEAGLSWNDLPRDNPLQTQGSAISKTVGFGVGATATTALDYTLKKTTELSSAKRHLISGGATTVVGLGVYATTKREDALWSAYGSIFATVGHLIYDKVTSK